MNLRTKKWVLTAAAVMEFCVSLIVLAAVGVAAFGLVKELGLFGGALLVPGNFDGFLAHALGLVVGVEFIKMLIKHTPGAAIEVLLYAIARQLIVEHTSTLETLIGIAAIAAVFAIRKYLFIRTFDETDRHLFLAERTVKSTGLLMRSRIPADPELTLGEVLQHELELRGEAVVEGASVSFPGMVLRAASVRDQKIHTVEIVLSSF